MPPKRTADRKDKNIAASAQNLFPAIDFSQLMDLRIDFAFKLLFGGKDTRYLISLLNAVFADKSIPRVIESLTVINPNLERTEQGDKLAILDIRAKLADGTSILIEMHLYDLGAFKYKTIRSWARAFGEELEAGQNFTAQPAAVCVAFINDAINGATKTDYGGKPVTKIHSLYEIRERDDHDLLCDAMELHYINMKAFIETINGPGGISAEGLREPMLTKWLVLIAQKEIRNRGIIEEICKDREEILMAAETLDRLSEDKYTRQAYQRRRDEWLAYNDTLKMERQRAEMADQRAEIADQRAEIADQRAEAAEIEIEKLTLLIAELQSKLKS